MTQDCLDSLSKAPESKRFPKGIHIIEAGKGSASKVEGISFAQPVASNPSSWSYVFLQHMAAKSFQKWLDAYNSSADQHPCQPYFVHQSFRFEYKDKEAERGVKKTLAPSVSGLVFLQGTVQGIQNFLKQYFPQYHLVNNCTTGKPVSIADATMQPFMNVMKTHPDQVTFLREPFERFARERVKLRVLTGPFMGYEGYIVRIDRDRQLVFNFGGYAVAIRGIHKEDFQVVE